jgi:hypothetical protein
MDSSSVWKGLVFGGTASCIAEVVTMPMDVCKTRMQIQNKLKPQYSGMVNALVKISSEEGASALWKGLKPALLRQASYGSLRYGLYTPLKKALAPSDGTAESLPMYKRVLAGATSGAIASGVANPTDLVKVRMQAAHGGQSSSLTRAFADIVKSKGVLGLYKGSSATVARATVLAAVELSSYDFFKQKLRPFVAEGPVLHFSTALCSGFFAALASSPFDVAKSRIMNNAPSGGAQAYSGILDVFYKTVRTEGVFSLWYGGVMYCVFSYVFSTVCICLRTLFVPDAGLGMGLYQTSYVLVRAWS